MQPNLTKSPTIGNISRALMVFHVKVDVIKKDSQNPHFKNNYASLSAILEAITDALGESDLSFVQFPDGENALTTILMHTSGEFIQATYNMTPARNDPQGAGSALTYMRRYALAAILGLNIEDDDAETASQPVTKAAPTPRPAAAQKAEIPWMNAGTKEFDGAVKKLVAGTTTLEKIKMAMKVSKATEEKLLAAAKAAKGEKFEPSDLPYGG